MNTLSKTIALITLLSLTFIFLGCESKETTKKVAKAVTSVEINTIKKQTYPIWVGFSGKTKAYLDVMIVPRINGELEKVLFKDGDIVKKGDVLFKVDDRVYAAILAQKEATLKKNQASLALAIANLKRYEPLVKKNLATKEKLDELIASKKQLEATVKADQSTINQARLDVEYCTIISPIDGRIGKSLIDIGNIVNNTSKLANIVQVDYLKVNFNPSSNEVMLINKYKSKKNPIVKVVPENLSDASLQLRGEIDFVDNVTNNMTGTIAMRAKIDNKEGRLFPGTFVEIQVFVTDKLSLIALDPNTVAQNQMGAYVMVLNEKDQIETRQIDVSFRNKDLFIIKEGLVEGDRVVVSAISKLRNNQKVIPKEVPNKITIED